MNTATTIKWTLACVLAVAVGGISEAYAQSALGGAKTQQVKIGGAAKPPPVVGGSIKPITPPSPPKPGPVISLTKPNSLAGTPPAISNGTTPGQTSAATRQNPPVTPSNKSKTVTASSNLKCASGACSSRGPRP
ncbi:hypothetical protein [Bradyrhizobium sp.]|uniref:hypothetical protein n=1 Tax=Bradyrhizobium sp. TaxID=376 RepID=UPI003C59BC4A